MIEEVARPINRRTRGERTKRRERYMMLSNEKLSPLKHFNNNSIICHEEKKTQPIQINDAKLNMKNENERHKEKSKLSVLKKKLSMAEKPDDTEQKLKKGKKSKKSSEVDQNVKSCKTSSFIRKFNFGKYMTTPSNIRRASSSKSVTASETSDKLSSGYSTLTPSSLKRQFTEEVEDTVSGEVYVSETPVDTCIEVGERSPSNDKQESGITSRQPVSVTPYAISAWRSTNATGVTDNETEQNQSHLHHDQQHNARVSSSHTNTEPEQQFMDDKLTAENNESEHREEDEQKSEVHVITEESSETDINKSDKIQKVDCNESVTETMPAFGNVVMDVLRSRPETSNISQSSLERKEHLYKILVIGELGTGKTSIIKRYVHQFFSQHYRATIGVDFALKVLNWDANTIIRLQLWDIAGQERFGNMTRVYYKDAVGAFIVFDVTRVATFDAVDKWKQDLDSKVQLPDGSSIPCVLLGNKCDQQKEGIVNTPARMEEYCKEKGFSGWFETSAKENVNIEDAAKFLVNKILLNDKLLHSSEMNKDNDRIAIDDKGDMNGHLKSVSKTCSC